MNRWQQTTMYPCRQCGEKFLHDRMYAHVSFKCAASSRQTNQQENNHDDGQSRL